MPTRFPNRVGELGTYVLADNAVTLSGQGLPGMRSFASALAALRIADGDTVGVAVRAASAANKWAVWQAQYGDAGVLTALVVEDQDIALADGDLVEVVVCVTDGLLARFALADEVDVAYGPGYWSPRDDPAGAEWLAMDAAWKILGDSPNGWLVPVASVAALRPATWSVDVYVPPGTDLLDAASGVGFVLLFGGGYLEQYVGAGVVEGWNTITGSLSGQTGDITELGLFGLYDNRGDFRFKNFAFTTP
jgi:hypothetical protein